MNEVILETPTIIGKARDFALFYHGEQAHGSLTIKEHLTDVAFHASLHYDPAVNHCFPEEVIAAAWLHDVVEDTNVSDEDVHERFGDRIGSIVSLLTDKRGKNRMERHLRTYHAIRQDNDAVLIKLCDRRHNHERSLKHGEHWMAMYEREYLYFKFALWTPHKFVKLWDELDFQHGEIKKILHL